MDDSPRTKTSVLVIEDEWWIAEMIAGVLDDTGYDVVGPADNVESSLSLIEHQRIDAALLDVNLGTEMSYPVADALIALGVPTLLITGYHHTDLPPRYHGLRLLSKPTTPKSILTALEQLLAGGGRP